MASKTVGKDAQNREVALLGSRGDGEGGGIGKVNSMLIHLNVRDMNMLAI